ncbi:MAG: dihydrodipicolinate synthase family protein [Rhizobiales bacterium 65-9]|nr:dihydrodipicolinate synthase family protein [Hyphomicrobiales bacterium]OJY34715.1 MAG: dihydrodipicolinate synthase family protein [Rhizobiales bacterium 65-9]
MSAHPWTGVFPAVTTRFTEDDRLDLAEMEKSFALQVKAGVDGLIVCGSLGEASTLDPAEKLEILALARRVAAGRIPVLLTIMEGSTRNACALAQKASAQGVDGFMVLPGAPYKSDPRETMAHYRAVAKAGGKPVMLYINPIAYGVDITPAMLAEMADEPLFVAVKESSDDVRRVTKIFNQCGDRYRVFTGVDNLALESFAVGAQGWVAGLVCAFPEETVAIWRLSQQGRLAEAIKIYRWFQPLLDLDVSTKLVQNIKLVEALVTGSNDRCRAPRLPLTGAERAHVESVVKKALATRPDLSGLSKAA